MLRDIMKRGITKHTLSHLGCRYQKAHRTIHINSEECTKVQSEQCCRTCGTEMLHLRGWLVARLPPGGQKGADLLGAFIVVCQQSLHRNHSTHGHFHGKSMLCRDLQQFQWHNRCRDICHNGNFKHYQLDANSRCTDSRRITNIR